MYRTLINDYAQSLYRPEGMIQLAQTLYQAGDLSAALDVLSRVMQDYPDSEEAEHAFSHAQSMRNAPPPTPAPPAEISQPPDTPEAGSDVTEPATEPTTEAVAEPAANQ
ncbi:hypothetical protein IIC65_09245 [Candidatus Sumerlaeota bacterium]|nr:hypothetical protein [Candidatus Sumerlaeota bacterium]